MPEALKSEIVAAVEGAIVGSPFGRLVGLEAESVAVDRVRVRLPFRADVTTIGEMVHGGAIASLVDVAATAAAWAHPDASLDARGSTVGFSLDFLAPGLGCDLVADARIRKRGRSLSFCDVAVTDSGGAEVARASVTYRLSAPKAEAGAFALVRRYAEAKSRQDADAALALCDPDFTIETIPFGLASRDRDDTARQLALFFEVFPDYRAETEGIAWSGESVAWWGDIALTFLGEFLGVAPTQRSAKLPAFSVFDFRDGKLLRERFHFDLAALCHQIGVPVETLSQSLRALRAAAD